MKRWHVFVLLGALAATFVVLFTRHEPSHEQTPSDAQLPEVAPDVRWLAVGGGAEAASTQVSMEQDLRAFQRAMSGPGMTLFAGGPEFASVARQGAPAHSLRARLAKVFDPRSARYDELRTPELDVDGPARA